MSESKRFRRHCIRHANKRRPAHIGTQIVNYSILGRWNVSSRDNPKSRRRMGWNTRLYVKIDQINEANAFENMLWDVLTWHLDRIKAVKAKVYGSRIWAYKQVETESILNAKT